MARRPARGPRPGWATSPRDEPRRARPRCRERAAIAKRAAGSGRARASRPRRRRRAASSSPLKRGLVAGRASRLAGEDRERALGGEPRRDERLVHAVAGERVDEPGRVADEQRRGRAQRMRPAAASAGGGRAGRSARRSSTPCAPQRRRRCARRRGPSRRPAADADVDVVRPSGRPSRSRPERRRARRTRVPRLAVRGQAPYGTFPSSATP